MDQVDDRCAARSLYERFLGLVLALDGREFDGLDAETRLLHYSWIFTDLGLKWCDYDQFLFFRGTREHFIVYTPFFFRSRAEFERIEKEFIKEATRDKGWMSQREFARRGRAFRARMNQEMIQGFVLGALKAPKAVGYLLDFWDAVQTVDGARKCVEGSEDECAKLIFSAGSNAVTGVAKGSGGP